MKKFLFFISLIIVSFTGCVPEDSNSDQIRGLIFEPSYGIESPQISSVTQSGIEVNIIWNRISNASFYHLYSAVNYPDLFVKVETTFTINEALIKDLEIGKVYYFYITAINEFGVESSQSNVVSITVE